MRDLHAEDERQARGLDLFLIGLAHHPGVGDDRHVRQAMSGRERLDDREYWSRSCSPRTPGTISGNPLWSVRSPMVICGSRLRPLESALAEPIALVSLEIQRGHVVKDQAGRVEPGMGGAGSRDVLPPRRLRIGGLAALERGICAATLTVQRGGVELP